MEGKRLLRSLTLKNVLSFGPEGMTLDFEPLNVLIGPNGSGKSNLIEILGLLRSLPTELGSSGQGKDNWIFNQWIWKGENAYGVVSLDSEWNYENETKLRHKITIGPAGARHVVVRERISLLELDERGGPIVEFSDGNAFDEPSELEENVWTIVPEKTLTNAEDPRRSIRKDQSILAHFRNDKLNPEISYLSDSLSEIKLYRNWTFGRESEIRSPQVLGQSDDFLAENARNLSLVLRRIQIDPVASKVLSGSLSKAYEGISEIRIEERGDDISLSLLEEGSRVISARRLSDGTLRYLCLLALLCDPTPPPLMCIEEPELGLHPDIIPTIAQLLVDASSRTQLIVTTHSADLISALGEYPESVVVCERGKNGTTMKRLEPERLAKWLEEYTLGHLWSMGEIGGNRW